MTKIDEALGRLRRSRWSPAGPVGNGLLSAGIAFAAVGGSIEQRWRQAVVELTSCIKALEPEGPLVLTEGSVYRGTWLESTASISAEVLTRFAPDVARDTFLQFARHQHESGLLPYKVTAEGAAFSQIQMVTPLARSVWNHYRQAGGDREWLATMYAAMSANDAWLAEFRDVRGTGCVEAFCTFDTGHDLSPRFWFAPDRCFHGDAARVDPSSPTLPYLAPDLTANVACQRSYLGLIAAELGEDSTPWLERAQASLDALWRECWDADDETFYDRDRWGRSVRLVSDVLLRVLACEVGGDDVFAVALERYLMSTAKLLSHYGFTSLAMDDPRFDHDFRQNSWGGPVNLLAQLRAPHAFERHGRFAELATAAMPVLAALTDADRFPQCLDPWTGAAGYAEAYSPSILWFLDAVERWFGILPRPDGEIWFTGLAPTRLGAAASVEAVAAARSIDGALYELAADDFTAVVLRDGIDHLRFPRGLRVVTDRRGNPAAVTCVAGGAVEGTLHLGGSGHEAVDIELTLSPNDHVELSDGRVVSRSTPGFIGPHT